MRNARVEALAAHLAHGQQAPDAVAARDQGGGAQGAAELAGADLRVMVMTRPIAEVLHSTSNGRVCLMERSCAALARQLEALDPAFYFCFPYGPESPQGAGDFLGTTDAALQDIVAAIYKPDNIK